MWLIISRLDMMGHSMPAPTFGKQNSQNIQPVKIGQSIACSASQGYSKVSSLLKPFLIETRK